MLNHPAKFGNHRQCGGGYTMFSVVEKQDSTCSHLSLPLLFIAVLST